MISAKNVGKWSQRLEIDICTCLFRPLSQKAHIFPCCHNDNNPCSGVTPVHPNRKNSSEPCLKGKSWQVGLKRVCFQSIFRSLEQTSHCKSIVKHFPNCTMLFKTNDRQSVRAENVLLHDNPRPHTAACTIETIQKF